MSTQVETFNQYLKRIGFETQLTPTPGVANSYNVVINHMGVVVSIYFEQGFIFAIVSFGYLPTTNVVPFFRRLLTVNGLIVPKLYIVENDKTVRMTIVLSTEGFDYFEFKWMLDTLGSTYWQYINPLVQEFQLPQQPS